MVECDYTNDFIVIGFQVVAQLRNFSEVRKIYVNKTTDRETAVSVNVKQDKGPYHVAIFSVIEERGILGSSIERAINVGDDDLEAAATNGSILKLASKVIVPSLP